jgi:hypothetical protein
MQQEFRPRIKNELKERIIQFAKGNGRTPTQETNFGLRWYLDYYNSKPHADKSRLSAARVTAGQPTREES